MSYGSSISDHLRLSLFILSRLSSRNLHEDVLITQLIDFKLQSPELMLKLDEVSVLKVPDALHII